MIVLLGKIARHEVDVRDENGRIWDEDLRQWSISRYFLRCFLTFRRVEVLGCYGRMMNIENVNRRRRLADVEDCASDERPGLA